MFLRRVFWFVVLAALEGWVSAEVYVGLKINRENDFSNKNDFSIKIHWK